VPDTVPEPITSYRPEAIRKSDLCLLGYAEFGQLLETLTENVRVLCRERSIRIDAVAPILRSGAFPGCHLASKLGVVDVLPLQYKHTYDPVNPIHRHHGVPKLTRDLSGAVILLADTNTVTGEIAQRAAADLRAAWPKSTIVFASVMLDVSLKSIPNVDFLVPAQRTNERRTLSRDAAIGAGISNDVFVFPWEEIEEQWREIQKVQSALDQVCRIAAST
jgi:hypothetical protein